MNKTTQINPMQRSEQAVNVSSSGLAVRTNLRAGLAWDDLDDQAAALWGKVTGTVSNAVSNITDSTAGTTTS